MKSLPSLPWRKVRHQPIGDRIIKLTNRCVWVIDVSNPLGGPQGKCQLINNMMLWTGSSRFNPWPVHYQGQPHHVQWISDLHITCQTQWKATALNISPSLKASAYLCRISAILGGKSTSNSPLSRRETVMSPLSKWKEQTPPLLALIRFGVRLH